MTSSSSHTYQDFLMKTHNLTTPPYGRFGPSFSHPFSTTAAKVQKERWPERDKSKVFQEAAVEFFKNDTGVDGSRKKNIYKTRKIWDEWGIRDIREPKVWTLTLEKPPSESISIPSLVLLGTMSGCSRRSKHSNKEKNMNTCNLINKIARTVS